MSHDLLQYRKHSAEIPCLNNYHLLNLLLEEDFKDQNFKANVCIN